MRLIIVRHADPDYSIDSLTPQGWKEAEYLSERLAKMETCAYYVSPLGRAKDTASCTLKKVHRTATECPWLREFAPSIWRPDNTERRMIVWDWLPQDWTQDERFFREDQWYQNEILQEGHVKEEYDWVVSQLDQLLEHHGYQRQGRYYRTLKANNDTIVLFCHYGVACVLLSHLINVSPMCLWHGISLPPSSVTTIYTEERRPGHVSFRANALGDTSHLYCHGEEPSFSARFCACYDNLDERHD